MQDVARGRAADWTNNTVASSDVSRRAGESVSAAGLRGGQGRTARGNVPLLHHRSSRRRGESLGQGGPRQLHSGQPDLAAGKAKPMIVVMAGLDERGCICRPVSPLRPGRRGKALETICSRVDVLRRRRSGSRRNSLTAPMAELSMGRGQGLGIGLHHLDIFSQVGRSRRRGHTRSGRSGVQGSARESGSDQQEAGAVCVTHAAGTDPAVPPHGAARDGR